MKSEEIGRKMEDSKIKVIETFGNGRRKRPN